MSPRSTGWSDLPHLIAFGLIHATVAGIRPTVSYRALELGADAGMIGIIGGSFAALSLVAAIPVGSRIDRRGERLFFMVGAAIVAASAVTAATAGVVVMLAVSQSLLGLGFLCTGLAIMTITAGSRPEQRDQRFASMSVAASAGQFVGPLVAGAIIARPSPIDGLRSTQVLFWTAMIAVGLAVVAAWKAPGWRNSAATKRGQPVRTSEALGLIRIPGMKEALVTSIAVLTAVDLLVAYLPVLGEDNGISPAFIGLVLSVQAGAGLISRLVVAPMIGRFGRRMTLIANIAVAGLALAGLSLVPPQPVLLVLGAVIGFGLGLTQPITTAWVADRAPDGRIGSALALRLAGNRLGALIAPAGVGLLAGIIGTPAVFMAASVGLFGSAWWMRSAPTATDPSA